MKFKFSVIDNNVDLTLKTYKKADVQHLLTSPSLFLCLRLNYMARD